MINIQPVINNNPPIGVTGPKNEKSMPVTLDVLNAYILPEKKKIPAIKK
jgi:hypothetical protein